MSRNSDDTSALDAVAKGFRKRTFKTLRLASSVGLRALKKTVKPSSPLRPTNGKAVEAAEKLFEQMDGLKGLVMKFGQMASYLDADLPPKAREILAKLQSNSQPLSYEVISAAVEEAFGAPVDELFESFEPTPFAAASIGQVHRARYEGRDVAVKVQYPGIEDAVRSDIKTLGRLTRLGSLLSAMDGKELAAELRERVLEECDYLAEADNQRLFGRLFGGDERVIVPRVVDERSRRRVLTTELAPGIGFQDFCAGADQAAKNQAGAIIFETVFGSLFRYGVFNADPHPGNYLFTDDARVVFLDFGSVRTFDADFIDRWKVLAKAVLAGDRATFRRLYVECGFVPKPDKFDWDYQWGVLEYVYEPFTTPGFRFTSEYVQRSYDLMIWSNPNRFKTAMPRDWLLLNRLQWGLNSVLALLEATAPWGELWRAALESPTEAVLDIGGLEGGTGRGERVRA